MQSLRNVRDEDLLHRLSDLVKQSRGVEADVVAHIGEVELRRLYAQEACSSMFEYCRRVLGLRENEAYLRITVARAARQLPDLLPMLCDDARLAPHLTRQNADEVLKRTSGMSHRCAKRHDLEFHHKKPFARGGDHGLSNVTLTCRTHNTLMAEVDYGRDVVTRFRASAGRSPVPVDEYGDRIVVNSKGHF
jgi:hypothetical protein